MPALILIIVLHLSRVGVSPQLTWIITQLPFLPTLRHPQQSFLQVFYLRITFILLILCWFKLSCEILNWNRYHFSIFTLDFNFLQKRVLVCKLVYILLRLDSIDYFDVQFPHIVLFIILVGLWFECTLRHFLFFLLPFSVFILSFSFHVFCYKKIFNFYGLLFVFFILIDRFNVGLEGRMNNLRLIWSFKTVF